MPEGVTRERDLVLVPNQYAFISDRTTGNISTEVGPSKKSLGDMDIIITYDPVSRTFNEVPQHAGRSLFPFADERSYIVLKSPKYKEDGKELSLPSKGSNDVDPSGINWGEKINIHGPITFALWPGQDAEVVPGHQLRTNQYLIVNVYNEEAAKENWGQGVVKRVIPTDPDAKDTQPPATPDDKKDESPPVDQPTIVTAEKAPDLVTGQLMIIKGTEVSFYIPPTGIEVVKDENNNYIREALTLEQLEYAILKSENGAKEYIPGPQVVFPEPTQTFVTRGDERAFTAIELNENMGIYIKVISPYDGHEAGEELFITGVDVKIYYPRHEHSIIKYGSEVIHYAIAIPKGEARYVLDKQTGDIIKVIGPKMFLPDPRKQVIVRRILTPRQSGLWFPGNKESLAYNERLVIERDSRVDSEIGPVASAIYLKEDDFDNVSRARYVKSVCATNFAGDSMKRKSGFTPPRMVILDSKYEGAVAIDVWPGFAVQVVKKTGERRVVEGPSCVLLEYDETLEVLSLSTGKPKTDLSLLETVYLQVKHNRVSDIVDATTKDLVDIQFRINYRLNFENDSCKWFSIENYVKFLTQHCRSMFRHVIKQHGVEEVNSNPAEIIRSIILGEAQPEKGREGRTFEENGMHIYDVEVLQLKIGDEVISNLLEVEQHSTVSTALELKKAQRTSEANEEFSKYHHKQVELDHESIMLKLNLTDKEAIAEAEIEEAKLQVEKDNQVTIDDIETAKLARLNKAEQQALALVKDRLEAKTNAFKNEMGSIAPNLIEAIITAGKISLATEMAKNLPKADGTIGHLLGIGGMSMMMNAVKGTPLEAGLKKLMDQSTQKEKEATAN